MHLVPGQFEDLAFEDPELNAIYFGQLGNKIDVAPASSGVRHEVAAVISGGVGERMTSHSTAVALVLGSGGNTESDEIAFEC